MWQLRKWDMLRMPFNRQIFQQKQQSPSTNSQNNDSMQHAIPTTETCEFVCILEEHKIKNEWPLKISQYCWGRWIEPRLIDWTIELLVVGEILIVTLFQQNSDKCIHFTRVLIIKHVQQNSSESIYLEPNELGHPDFSITTDCEPQPKVILLISGRNNVQKRVISLGIRSIICVRYLSTYDAWPRNL